MENFITRIKKSINESNIKKTKQLLKELKSLSFETKLEVLQIFALAPDIIALNLMPVLMQKEYIDEEIYDRVVHLLTDRAHLNFHFILILYNTSDKEIISQMIPLMKHILSKETDFEILRETIKTAGRQRFETLADDIAEFIFYDETKLKAEAVKALERIGSDDAYENLLKAAKSSKCDQDILDSIEVLKNKKEKTQTIRKKEATTQHSDDLSNDIANLNNNLESNDIRIRYDNFSKLADLGSGISQVLIKNLESENHDIIINTLNLISRTIPKPLIPELFNLLRNKNLDKKIKFAVYTALDAFPELESTASAIVGIIDPLVHIRTAAIKVLDKNPTDFVIAEIKEKIESGTGLGKKIGESILDAHANNLIIQLLVSDAFSYILSNYLEKKAPLQVLETHIQIQKQRNLHASAKKYEKILKKKQKKERPCFIIISNSQIRTYLYTKILFAAGYDSKTFRNSQTAFESIMTDKPFAVICDLFLNDMIGLDLLKEIRDIHPEEELPIIFSTLQNDFLDQDKNIIAFPPNTNQIQYCFKHL